MESILPKSLGKLTKPECADLLTRALEESKIENKSQLSKLTGIPFTTLSSYLRGIYRPPQENWNIIRRYLCSDDSPASFDNSGNGDEADEADKVDNETEHHVKKVEALCYSINSLIFILKDELDYFKDNPERVREILKKHFKVKDAAYTMTLFQALYNEEELNIWKTF